MTSPIKYYLLDFSVFVVIIKLSGVKLRPDIWILDVVYPISYRRQSIKYFAAKGGQVMSYEKTRSDIIGTSSDGYYFDINGQRYEVEECSEGFNLLDNDGIQVGKVRRAVGSRKNCYFSGNLYDKAINIFLSGNGKRYQVCERKSARNDDPLKAASRDLDPGKDFITKHKFKKNDDGHSSTEPV
jgi:hypothetical protein